MVWIVHRFLNYLHDRPSRRLNFSISVIVIAVGILTSPVFSVWIDSYHLSPFFYIILIGIGFVASLHGWIQSALAHSQDGRLLAFWGLLGMAMGSYDLLLQNNVINIESIYLGPFTNIFAFLILMRIIYGRYMAAIDEVRAVNASLQERLDAREKELEKSHELLRQVEVQRQLSQERQRLMQDMHDGMGSNLRTALLAVEAGKLNPPAVADILKDCIDDLKLTIDSMEPMDADLLLLLAMFRFRFGTRLEAAGITLHWDVQPIPKVKNLTPQSTLHIFRIFQEAFANVIKHSGATQITVSTRVSSNHVSVIISDNGRGFSLNTGHVGDGRGLLNQKRRAEFIGATIDWITGPTGTQMTLLLPID
jgi:signal transduction histidine kinase